MEGLFYDEHCAVSGARLPGKGASLTMGEAEAFRRGKAESAAEIERLRAALREIERLSGIVAHDLTGRIESGKVFAVQRCRDTARAALAGRDEATGLEYRGG